jgi:hypothetical protein
MVRRAHSEFFGKLRTGELSLWHRCSAAKMGHGSTERTALSRNRTATLEPTGPAPDPASDPGHQPSAAPRKGRKGPSFSGASRNTGPLSKPRSARKKKGLFRRTGVVLPAVCVAVVLVAAVTVAAVKMSPRGKGAVSIAPAFSSLLNSRSLQLLEQERQNLIVLTAASKTLSSAATPQMVSPSKVMKSMAAANSAANSSNGTGSNSGGSSSNAPPAPLPDAGSAKRIAYDMLPSFGFNQTTQYSCLVSLWNQESGWRYNAENASGAYGIPQSLPGSKMASAGSDWLTNPRTQIKWGLGYISQVYGTPCSAWGHEESAGWY